MSKLAYRTIGNEHPQGKPRVYFACHPDDLSGFLEDYALKILRIQTCAVWYETEYDADYDREELEAQLSEMQLIVMPVTTKLLTTPNRAMDVEYAIAQEKHIPVLPIMLEGGLTDVFTKRFGNLQYIDPNDQDPTRRSFDEVLETYIKAVLVGDEMAKRVRAAFDAYIFLSYRKKDRAKAQNLMRLIHKSPLCQDIAIWYDEFLTPGEDFNDLIGMMLEKSDLFALAVTPNLINEINYVMTTEYPAARTSGKAILPVEMEKTDREKLGESYEGIPDPVDSEDEEALLAALQKILHTVAISENDTDPKHCFLIGLAYLDGIDVEVDFERAVRLIRFAAEAGVPEAMEQLVTMYEAGKGVSRDYHEGVAWRRKHVEHLRLRYEAGQGSDALDDYVYGLRDLGDSLYALGFLEKAMAVYQKMLDVSAKEMVGNRLRWWISTSYNKLGYIAEAQGRLKEAKEYYEKSLEIRLAFAKETVTMESREDLSYNYHKLGDIAGMQERLEEAREYYERSLEINHALVEETGTVESRQMLSVSYERLGVIAQAQGRLEKAKEYYEKSLEIRLALAKETGTAESRRGLSVIYEKLGDIAEVEGRLEEAKEYYEKTLEIRLALAIETGTIESRRDFSVSYEKLGDIAEVEGRLEEAKEYYEKSLESYLALTKETGTARSRRDLFLSYEKLGDTARAQERLEEAKEYYVKALEISLALVQETGTAESRRFLSHSYGRFGAIAEAQGRLEEAQKYYEKCLEIKLALAKETRTLQAYEDLQIICFNFGAFLFNSGTDIDMAKEMFQIVVQIGEEGGYPQLKELTDQAKEILSQYF